MKPIKLIISGFNSFIEKQTIDFTKITSFGMFGIFGPTGSGKSSILDAITFSLFGKIDRGDGVFVNTNCKTAFVSFSFTIRNDIYEIERVINSKDGSYKTKSIKMLKNDEIIGQKDREIEKILYDDVLGLTFDDFVTAVVLPQGKFSEFLKTSPKDRRGLIERLFDLKKYGTDLSAKIKRFKDNLEINYANIQGEYKGFEGVDEEDLKNMKDIYEKKLLEREKAKKDILIFNEEYMKIQNLWIMDSERKSLKDDLNLLIIENSQIDEDEIKLNNYKLVKDFLPVKKRITDETGEIEDLKIKEEAFQNEINNLNENLSVFNLNYEELVSKRINHIPNLNKELESINKDIELLEEKEDLNKKLKNLNMNLKKILDEFKDLENKNKIYIDEIQKTNEELIEKELILKENEISEIYLNRIIKASDIEKNANRLLKDLEQSKKYLKNLTENKENLCKDLLNFENESSNLKVSLEKNEKEIFGLDKEIELGRESLVSLTNEANFLNSVKEKWDKILNHMNLNEEKTGEKNKIIHNYSLEKDEIEKQIKLLEDLRKENSTNEAIKILLPILESENKCPLCKSHGPFENLAKVKDLSFNDRDLNKKIKKLKDVDDSIIVNKTQVKSLEEEFLKLKEETYDLSKDFISIEELNNRIIRDQYKIEDIKNINIELQKKRSDLNNTNLYLKKEFEKINSNVHETSGRIKGILNEISFKETQNEKDQLDLEGVLREYEIEKEFFKTDLIEELKKSTLKKETVYKNLRKQIIDKTNLLNDLISKKHKLTEKINEAKLSSMRFKDEIETVSKRFSHIVLNLKFESKAEFEKRIYEIKNTIKKIEKEYVELNDKIKKLESLKQEKTSYIEQLRAMILVKDDLLKVSTKSLKEDLIKLNLDEDIEKYEIKEKDALFLEKSIMEFKKKHETLKQKITNLNEKLDDFNLTNKEWNDLNQKKEELEHLKAKIEEETGALKKEIEIKSDDLKRAKELKSKLDMLSKKKDIVEEIQKITKGNSIMDFVAHKQLKYISSIASNTLSNITGTRYNIIIDETGEFMIRDLLNGGEKRKVRSLSGGELFLTSLSMALALSSHIQLKGKMCLEFFFLDEGFGTLDKDSLEVVLKALEKIKNKNLTIGIISHLKEIQERMPVKIMVTPASTDRGSAVKII